MKIKIFKIVGTYKDGSQVTSLGVADIDKTYWKEHLYNIMCGDIDMASLRPFLRKPEFCDTDYEEIKDLNALNGSQLKEIIIQLKDIIEGMEECN